MNPRSDEVLRPGELRPGDLVFLPPIEELGRKVVELDRGRFSHVGILVEPGVMASARTRTVNWGTDLHDGIDLGGVRLDALRDLAIRRPVYAAKLRDEHVPGRAHALEHVQKYVEVAAGGPSGFSYVKLFLISLGLNALSAAEPEKQAMLAPVVDAAWAWDAAKQIEPTFFCSEYVASTYAKSFTMADFDLEEPSELTPPAGIAVFDDATQWLDRLGTEVEGAAWGRFMALLRAVRAVRRYDEAFLGEMGELVVKLLKQLLGPKAETAEAAQVSPPTIDPTTPIPAALVTPRMLEHDDNLHHPVKRVLFDPPAASARP